MIPWLLLALLATDLGAIKSEQNPEHRSDMALAFADNQVNVIREAYQKNDIEAVKSGIADANEAIELAYTSLTGTGKDPRRSPKAFKRAEMSTHQLLRRLDAMMESMDFMDRPLVEPLKNRVSEVHEELLTGVMGKKKK